MKKTVPGVGLKIPTVGEDALKMKQQTVPIVISYDGSSVFVAGVVVFCPLLAAEGLVASAECVLSVHDPCRCLLAVLFPAEEANLAYSKLLKKLGLDEDPDDAHSKSSKFLKELV